MLFNDLRRKAIVKKDFSTFGYKFYLDKPNFEAPSESALIIDILLEADIKKVSHGFFVFIDIKPDLDLIYNEFFPKIEKGLKFGFIFNYDQIQTIYADDFIEDLFSKIKDNNIEICLTNVKKEYSISDNLLKYISYIMINIDEDITYYENYIKTGISPIYINIDSQEKLEKALNQDKVDLFSGDYIESPKRLTVKIAEKPTGLITQLFIELRSPNDLKKAIDIIKRSPELTYSILKFINSAFFAIPNRVSSVESAVTLLGFNNLRKWVNLLFLSSISPNAADNIYIEKSVIRAYFMEKIARTIDINDKDKQNIAYMTGLLSMLDIMLDSTFEEIFKDIPVTQEVYDALVNKNNFYAELLDFVRSFEYNDKEKQKYYCEKFNIDENVAARIYFEAIYEYDRFKQAIL